MASTVKHKGRQLQGLSDQWRRMWNEEAPLLFFLLTFRQFLLWDSNEIGPTMNGWAAWNVDLVLFFFLRFAENRKRSANGFGLKDATRKAARREEALGAPYPAERGRLLFFLFVFFSSTNIQILIQWFAFPATPQRRRRRLGQTKPKPKHGEKNSMCIQINVFITSKRLWRDIQGCGDS